MTEKRSASKKQSKNGRICQRKINQGKKKKSWVMMMLERGDEVNSEHHSFLQLCATALVGPAELLTKYLQATSVSQVFLGNWHDQQGGENEIAGCEQVPAWAMKWERYS